MVVSIFLSAAALADSAPFIFIVRHAEKATNQGNDPDLSQAGQTRADALARVLKDSQTLIRRFATIVALALSLLTETAILADNLGFN